MTRAMRAVLFDFDGTLADTAPDLGGALNDMRTARGLAPVPLEQLRPHTSAGARGLLKVGFGIDPTSPDYEALREEFLARYGARSCLETLLFPGMSELLACIESRQLRWGIVTNKPERYTLPIVEALGLAGRAACVVGGDTTAHAKPHPAPMFEAARRIDVPPQACWYLGDDLRDVQAARASGMRPVAVAYGYLGTENGRPEDWNADLVIGQPLDLVPHL